MLRNAGGRRFALFLLRQPSSLLGGATDDFLLHKKEQLTLVNKVAR